MSADAYPLTWPQGWPRARSRKSASFHESDSSKDYKTTKTLTLATALDRLEDELKRLDAKTIIVSTNRERRVNGMISAAGSEPADPGVAVYFKLKGKDTALACDTWTRVADNVNAIAKHVGAIRGMERWGVGTVEQVFTGYQALPAPEQWWQVLGVAQTATAEQIDAAWRKLAATAHPDKGGSDAAMSRLNAARDAAKRARGEA
jgi:hypothetical protein